MLRMEASVILWIWLLTSTAHGQMIVSGPVDTAAHIGHRAQLDCTVDMQGQDDNIEWRHFNDETIGTGGERVYASHDPDQLKPGYDVINTATEHHLIILTTSMNTTGTYLCRIIFADVEAYAALVGVGEVECRSRVIGPGYHGVDAIRELTCDASYHGTLTPHLLWNTREGDPLDGVQTVFASSVSFAVEVNSLLDAPFNCTLIFNTNSTLESPPPTYTNSCISFGLANPPESPSNLVVKAVTAVSAELQWDPGQPHSGLQIFTIYYDHSPEGARYTQYAGTDVSATVTDHLTPLTKYSARVEADNGHGQALSYAVEFTTPAVPGFAELPLASVDSSASQAVFVRWALDNIATDNQVTHIGAEVCLVYTSSCSYNQTSYNGAELRVQLPLGGNTYMVAYKIYHNNIMITKVVDNNPLTDQGVNGATIVGSSLAVFCFTALSFLRIVI